MNNVEQLNKVDLSDLTKVQKEILQNWAMQVDNLANQIDELKTESEIENDYEELQAELSTVKAAFCDLLLFANKLEEFDFSK